MLTINTRVSVQSKLVSLIAGSDPDIIAPTLANLVVDDTVSPVTVTYDLTENSGSADVHWVLVANGATAPTATEISNGQASGGGSPADSGTFASQVPGSGVGDTTTFATGLEGSYDIYLVAEDAAPNLSNVVSDTALSIDTTAPVSTITGVTAGSGALSIDWTTDTGEGPARIVVVPNGDTAPISTEILAGQESGGAAADGDSGNITVSGTGAQTTVVITGLTNGTAYDAYLAHEDAAVEPNAVTDASTNHTPVLSGFAENRVRFGTADTYYNFPTVTGFNMFTGGLVFLSVEKNAAGTATFPTVMHSHLNTSLALTYFDNAGNFYVSFKGASGGTWSVSGAPTNWGGTGRINVLIQFIKDNGSSQSEMVVYTKVGTNAWTLFGTDTVAGTSDYPTWGNDLTLGQRTDLTTGSCEGHDFYRAAMWKGVAPDISLSATQDNFIDPATHTLEDPATAQTAYSALIRLFDKNDDAAGWNSTTTGGDGTVSVTGAAGGAFSDI